VTDALPLFVLGNFNVNAREGNEYENLTRALKVQKREVVDVVYKETGEHPITYGAPGERILTPPADREKGKSVDFAFYLKPSQDYVVEKVVGSVQKFAVEGRPYGQLSAHYGIGVTTHFVNLLEQE
jgi:hypothetical protein